MTLLVFDLENSTNEKENIPSLGYKMKGINQRIHKARKKRENNETNMKGKTKDGDMGTEIVRMKRKKRGSK